MVTSPHRLDAVTTPRSPQTAERKKRWAAKVKTGCLTCRARRVKCDETKPSCKRCVSVGRACGGYSSQLTVAEKLCTPILQPSGLPALPFYAQSSRREEQMFHLLCTEAAVKVAGAFDQDFWSVDVPRATQTYPAIWHASVSLAAVYKRVQNKDQTPESQQLYNFSLTQYNKSIQQLVFIDPQQAELSYQDQETLLLASILFTSICILQEDQETARVHIDSGIQLFNKWRFWEHSAKSPKVHAASTTNSLVALFTRFELQSSLSTPPKPYWQTITFDKRHAPSDFTSATEAYYEQQQLLNNLIKVFRTQVVHHIKGNLHFMPDNRLPYRYQYRRWKTRFQKLQNVDHRAKLILQMYSHAIEIILYAEAAQAELCWDRYTYAFRRIFSLAKELFHQETDPNSKNNGAVTLFSFSPVSCHPFLGIGALCRDGALRRSSIELLKQWPLRDGMVNYKIAAANLEAIMTYEESHRKKNSPCQNCEIVAETRVCGDHRVIYRDAEHIGDGEGRLRMTTVGDVKYGREGKAVNVTW
ncbi:tRNA-His guanylyltransferase [Conoideocrella luteorostrata]|uniref:tRNA-His guanylyltransferase n=1 Tax=Conoideocrella luteorostrata TaxID=1105319 RepID=A0AAJ0CIG9_9HYPO|nr:tRNA-His guanylyltransferase [Conoideocrella luteorostrata]